MTRTLSALVLFAALAGPAGAAAIRPATTTEIAAVRAAMQTKLKDADSAKFLEVRMKGEKVCGLVNAKNSLGAYSGFRHFIGMVFAIKGRKTAYIVGIADSEADDVEAKMCADEGF